MPLFPPVLGNQTRDILFGKTELARALLTIGKDFLPPPLSQIAFDGLAQHVACGTALFISRGLHLGNKGRRKGEGIGIAACRHGTGPPERMISSFGWEVVVCIEPK
jgi:hypothetical protein